jgi:hypothetical protein
MNIIERVTLVENGISGLKLKGKVEEFKDGFSYMTPAKHEPKYPIHLGLEKKFKELRSHLLNLCEVCQNPRDEMEFEFAVNDTTITDVELKGNNAFVITGTKLVNQETGKTIKLKTAVLEEEDKYPEFAEVKKIFGEILEEVREYAAGNRPVSVEEMGLRYVENLIRKGKKGEEDLNDFKNMSEEEQKAFCQEFLQGKGYITVNPDENFVIDEETTPVIELNAKTA